MSLVLNIAVSIDVAACVCAVTGLLIAVYNYRK